MLTIAMRQDATGLEQARAFICPADRQETLRRETAHEVGGSVAVDEAPGVWGTAFAQSEIVL